MKSCSSERFRICKLPRVNSNLRVHTSYTINGTKQVLMLAVEELESSSGNLLREPCVFKHHISGSGGRHEHHVGDGEKCIPPLPSPTSSLISSHPSWLTVFIKISFGIAIGGFGYGECLDHCSLYLLAKASYTNRTAA